MMPGLDVELGLLRGSDDASEEARLAWSGKKHAEVGGDAYISHELVSPALRLSSREVQGLE